ncbi:MAG: tetratricopeptide repeat protein [Spirochaetales bacterium]|nr:tetratricopeptide repeat protein [Spirochaetales bacterium]
MNILSVVLIGFLFFFSSNSLKAQEEPDVSEVPAEETVQEVLGLVYPQDVPGLIYIEAENAVSTNFTTQATLDYSSSGQRMIQLNKTTDLYEGAAYFAEFVFLVEEPGTYQLWYSGTPPGPADQLLPSYASPFSYVINEGERIPVYRENTAVVEPLSSILYWVTFGEADFEPGLQTLRIEVAERRGYDNKYYLYLDSIFLLKTDAPAPDPAILAHPFPKNLEDRTIDNPYRSINDYQFLISEDPQNVSRYITLSTVYSLVGDYQSTLRYLIRAQLIEPENPQLLLLTAKNRIWRGDVAEGLDGFERYLSLYPDDQAVWAEAAKIAAWTSQYDRSISLYRRARELFPDDLNLFANMALTYLWANRGVEGLRIIREAKEFALESPDKVAQLARAFDVNGYADQAQSTYEEGLEKFPEYVELTIELSNLLLSQGQAEAADQVLHNLFVRSGSDPGLNRYLDTLRQKQSLSDALIQRYRDRLALDPDNLELRDALSQALFWNGRRTEAIQEQQNILINRYYRNLMPALEDFAPLLDRTSEGYQLLFEIQGAGALAPTFIDQLQRQLVAYNLAGRFLADVRTALDRSLQRIVSLEGDALVSEQAKAQNLEIQVAQAMETQSREQQNMNELFALVSVYLANIDALGIRGESLTSTRQDLEADLVPLTNQLEQVKQQKNWSYDHRVALADLIPGALQGNALADGSLSFLYLGLARWDSAREALSRATPPNLGSLPVLESYFQSWTGQGSVEVASPSLPAFIPQLGPESFVAEVDRLRTLLREVPSKTQGYQAMVQAFLQWSHQAQQIVAAYRTYLFEEETYVLRNQIAQFMVADGNYSGAVQQFSRVLVMDPQNVEATYQLATVQERLGNWSAAMKTYERVHEIDRGNSLAILRFNELSALHPRVVTGDFVTMTDTGRTTSQANLGFSAELSSRISFQAKYSLENQRIHTASGIFNNPESTQFHTLGVSMGFALIRDTLFLEPRLGVVLQNRLVEDLFSQIPAPIVLADLVGALWAYPRLGADLRLQTGVFSATLGYHYAPVLESLGGLRFPTMSHRPEATISLVFPFPQSRVVNHIASRTYGALDLRRTDEVPDQTPYTFTVAQDVSLSLHLADNPWTTFNIPLGITYEDGDSKDVESFYVPDRVFTFKGGVQASTWIGLGNTGRNVLGIGGRIAGGVYRDWEIPEGGLATDPKEARVLPLIDGDFRFDLALGPISFYLSGYGSAAIRNSGVFEGLPAYFATQFSFGVRNTHSRVLVP